MKAADVVPGEAGVGQQVVQHRRDGTERRDPRPLDQRQGARRLEARGQDHRPRRGERHQHPGHRTTHMVQRQPGTPHQRAGEDAPGDPAGVEHGEVGQHSALGPPCRPRGVLDEKGRQRGDRGQRPRTRRQRTRQLLKRHDPHRPAGQLVGEGPRTLP